MESLLFGSFPKPSPLSFPTAGLSSLTTGSHVAVHVSRCRAVNILGKYNVLRFHRQVVMHYVERTDEQSAFYQRRNTRYLVKAASGHPLESEPEAYHSRKPWKSLQDALDAFYRFSRPHTVIGTALSILSVSLLAVENLSDFSPLFFTGVLEAIVAALLMNIYIVGLNQLSDIEIDKVNKPYLPLASGEYSVKTGVLIVSSFAIMLPLLRWKRFAFVAAMCILAVRAVIVQIAFYLHMQVPPLHLPQTYVYRRGAMLSRPLIFATAFMSFFSVVIALFKDIPDIDGDKIYGIRSFTVRLGQERVFWICISLLQMAYGVAVLVGVASSCLWSKYITVLGHALLASILWNRAKSIDLKSKAAITTFYMFIWKHLKFVPDMILQFNSLERMVYFFSFNIFICIFNTSFVSG
ncbi:homogentisate phytyltransferase 1, chloroplastic-like isoform X4 [Cornus florida]|uniref:homogentisate phytyltransferase 1, chloroplastic-like isoform X4 n=1 Tax=Cornus florida TaxID=4283 RepID=UPI0028A175C5|nr:homogentisate phytyltransferase 1, chloroplastic-like isoform X4 [Cornus florida]